MGMTKWSPGLAALLGVVSSVAQAASFNCARATRPVEKLICGDTRLNTADERLGQAYRIALGRLPTTGVGLLRVDQVQWLAWMQEICHAPLPDASPAKTGRSTAAGDVAQCMLPLYAERSKQLRTIVFERDSIGFLLRTQYLAAPEDTSDPGSPEFPGFGTLQVSWPAALAESAEWQAWNRAAESEAHSLTSDDSKPAKNAPRSRGPVDTGPGRGCRHADRGAGAKGRAWKGDQCRVREHHGPRRCPSQRSV